MSIIKTITAAVILAAAVSCGNSHKREAKVSDMQWRKIEADELAMQPVKAFDKDWMALSAGKEEMNAMTVSWGAIGVLWNKPAVTIYVRAERYTKSLIDRTGTFTLTILPKTAASKTALAYIGSHSRADEEDKMANSGLGFDLTENGVPFIREGVTVLECKVMYKDQLKLELMPDPIKKNYESQGMHTMYIAEIVNVYTRE